MEIKLPATVTLANGTDKDIIVVAYAQNFRFAVPANSNIKLDVLDNAEVVLYYLAQATDGLTVTQAAKANS